jgi:hypothetical protein
LRTTPARVVAYALGCKQFEIVHVAERAFGIEKALVSIAGHIRKYV